MLLDGIVLALLIVLRFDAGSVPYSLSLTGSF